jgi:CBS domain-containing protein
MATRWASRGGQAFGYLLVGFGLLSLWQGYMLNGLWAAFIGWFLSSAASSSWRQFQARQLLAHVPVERVMTADPVALDAEARVADVVEEHFLRRPFSAYPVTRGREVVGLVTLDDVSEVPPDRRHATPISAIMTRLDDVPTAEPGETLDEVLSRVSAADLNRVVVVRDGRLVGLVTMGEIAGWLERARKLGLEEGEVPPPVGAGDRSPAEGAEAAPDAERDETESPPRRER